jgi:hypothetical protein
MRVLRLPGHRDICRLARGVCNATPIWLLGDAKLAAKELVANPLGGELVERNSHRGCKLGRGKKLAAK